MSAVSFDRYDDASPEPTGWWEAGSAAANEAVGRAVRDLPRLGGVRLLCVDGPSGSGKSTFAERIVSSAAASGIDVRLVGTDDFATWDEPVRWWSRLALGVLDPLSRGYAAGYRRTEWPGGEPVLGDWVRFPAPDMLVLEGVSAGRLAVRGSISVLVWVEFGNERVRLERAVAREGEHARGELLRWQAFEREWFAMDATRRRADLHVRPSDQ